MTESEQDVENSEGKADDSVTTGGRKKRRQTSSSAALPTPGQRRYNLRRHTATAAGKATEEQHTSSAKSRKTKNDDGLSHKGNDQPSHNLDDAPAQSLDITVDSERKLNAVEVSTPRSMDFSSDRIVRFDATAKAVDSNTDVAKSVENTALSGEVKSAQDTLLSEGTSENVDEGNNRSTFNDIREEDDDGENDNDDEDVDNDDDGGDSDDDDDDGDDNDDDDGHPGQASVGKKIWKFLTT